MGFKAGKVYRLKDAERYDDEYGEGYNHVEAVGDCDGMIITDCWVVNASGDIHPGYDECPIPVRFEDVEETNLPAINNERARSGFVGWR